MLFAHLVQIDDRLPELILQLVEVSHAHFAEVTGMVFVEIGPVMMLSTRHTTSTGMLSVFANAAVASGDMTAASRECVSYVRTSVLPKGGRQLLRDRKASC